jgi:hypothetical protein
MKYILALCALSLALPAYAQEGCKAYILHVVSLQTSVLKNMIGDPRQGAVVSIMRRLVEDAPFEDDQCIALDNQLKPLKIPSILGLEEWYGVTRVQQSQRDIDALKLALEGKSK